MEIFLEIERRKETINEDQVLVNLYHLAMNHEDLNHSHDISIIKLK